jgi:putative membrane protein
VTVADLPTLNATLNGASAVLLGSGYAMIRQRRIAAHRAFMLAAWVTSMLFLASYTVYHAFTGSRPYSGQGAARTIYFIILISHVVLAAVVLPLAITTLARALGGRYPAHARLARWTLPVWLYVSVTGVVVYLMLYRI